eukprot:876358-Pleurochrysis_carterae.AAC.2
MRACEYACTRARVRACVRAWLCMRACVYASLCAHAHRLAWACVRERVHPRALPRPPPPSPSILCACALATVWRGLPEKLPDECQGQLPVADNNVVPLNPDQ